MLEELKCVDYEWWTQSSVTHWPGLLGEWQKRECHLPRLNGEGGGGRGGRGHKVGEQLRNPRHRVWQWPWHVTRGGMTDQGRAGHGQMCLHSACPVIATLLSLASSLSWASHILWQDGILRNYGNVAQMSLHHWNCDSLSHTCHAHSIVILAMCPACPVQKTVMIYRKSLGFLLKYLKFWFPLGKYIK